MSDTPDVIIVGGGAIGCGAAYYLAREGVRTRIIEAGKIGHACSHGNCGLICPSHALPLTTPGAVRRVLLQMFARNSPFYVRPRVDLELWSWLTRFAICCRESHMRSAAVARNSLLRMSMKLYHELIAEESLDIEWEDRGLLFVFKTPREFHAYESSAETLRRECGVELVPYAGSHLTELEPTLRPELAGAWHCPTDAHLRPDRLMSSLVSVLLKRGVEIVEGVAVEQLEVSAGRLRSLRTSQGTMSADMVVIAAGAESPQFARTLRCSIPIQPGKGYSITYPIQPHQPRIPMIFEQSHVALTPWSSGLRIGSTMEFVGYDRTVNRRRIELFKRAAAEHLVESPMGSIEEEWYGWRPMTYDELPCIGPVPRVANVIVAAGHGMLGMSTMTGTGKLVSDIALNRPSLIDPSPYALTRFSH